MFEFVNIKIKYPWKNRITFTQGTGLEILYPYFACHSSGIYCPYNKLCCEITVIQMCLWILIYLQHNTDTLYIIDPEIGWGPISNISGLLQVTKKFLKICKSSGKNCSYLNSHKKFQNYFPNILYYKTAKLQFSSPEINIFGEGRQNLRFGQYISHFFCLRCTCFIAFKLCMRWENLLISILSWR